MIGLNLRRAKKLIDPLHLESLDLSSVQGYPSNVYLANIRLCIDCTKRKKEETIDLFLDFELKVHRIPAQRHFQQTSLFFSTSLGFAPSRYNVPTLHISMSPLVGEFQPARSVCRMQNEHSIQTTHARLVPILAYRASEQI